MLRNVVSSTYGLSLYVWENFTPRSLLSTNGALNPDKQRCRIAGTVLAWLIFSKSSIEGHHHVLQETEKQKTLSPRPSQR